MDDRLNSVLDQIDGDRTADNERVRLERARLMVISGQKTDIKPMTLPQRNYLHPTFGGGEFEL